MILSRVAGASHPANRPRRIKWEGVESKIFFFSVLLDLVLLAREVVHVDIAAGGGDDQTKYQQWLYDSDVLLDRKSVV